MFEVLIALTGANRCTSRCSSRVLPPGYENASNCSTTRFAPSTDAVGARANSEKQKTTPQTVRRHCPRRVCTVVISETVVE